jgi:HK97 family phage prohead protease
MPNTPIHRAYSTFHVKRIDNDSRVIEGMATTPTPDRMGDIIEPLGAIFRNPLPFLWQHHPDKPVGEAKFAKPTKDGIAFKARIVSTDAPGALKERLDEAWQSVKLGLVSAVSIGFRSLERSFMADGGIHFLKTEILELSLVTIPANADATITAVKSARIAANIDAQIAARVRAVKSARTPARAPGSSRRQPISPEYPMPTFGLGWTGQR